MNTVSKEIIDKLRQLSDLLVVIKDSGNNTPQILKELAVEKCSEIYKALSFEDDVVGYKTDSTQTEVTIEDIEEAQKSEEVEFFEDDVTPVSDVIGNSEEENNDGEEVFEGEVEEREDSVSDDETLLEETESDKTLENDKVSYAVQEFEIEEENSLNEEEVYIDDQDTEEENSLNEEEDDYVYNDLKNDDEPPFDIEYLEDNEVEKEENENTITTDEDIDLFAPKENFKKCNHKKIRSVLSINDIFLYKRELFGNSDVDMTDMFDGIDEAESFDDAMEYISEYFGSDVETEEMVIEFIERVKQCFE